MDILRIKISFLAALISIFSVGFLLLLLKNMIVGLLYQLALECDSRLLLGKWINILFITSPTNFLT